MIKFTNAREVKFADSRGINSRDCIRAFLFYMYA